MPYLISLALGWKWPSWAAKLFGWAIPIIIAIAVVIGAIALVYHRGETAGGAKVQAKAVAAHTKSVADARTDERKAQDGSAAVGAAVGRANDETTAVVTAKRMEINNAVNSTPRAAPGAAPARVDTVGLSASVDALVDRANRAAEAADAQP